MPTTDGDYKAIEVRCPALKIPEVSGHYKIRAENPRHRIPALDCYSPWMPDW